MQNFDDTIFNFLNTLIYFFIFGFDNSYLKSIVGPTTEFHVTILIIKWKPRDVYLACAFEDTRGHVQTATVMLDNNICVVRSIESLIRAIIIFWFYVLVIL